jgi:uncharacterized protein
MPHSSDSSAPLAGAPSDVLMALYTGDRDRAQVLAATLALTLPELAAFGDLDAVSRHVTHMPDDVAAFSNDGWTALHLAGYFGYAAVVARLIRAGANCATRSRNAQGNTALHAALAGRGTLAVLCALIAATSDVNAIDAQGVAPLHLAGARGDLEAAQLLVACGADHTVRMPDGRTAADYAVELGHEDVAAWMRVL